MAKYHGRGGALLLGATNAGAAANVANLTQWSLTIEQDTAEVTSLGDTFKSYVAGMKGATASLSGFFDDAADIPFDAFDQAQGSGTVSAYMYPAGTSVNRYFYGAVWPTNVSIDDSVGGAVTFTAALTFNGAVTRVG